VAENIEETDDEQIPDQTAESTADDLDELPEEQPLTPELVEEEAIRGDFMLRWAAILLMILFAFAKYNDTRLLVHIRSGEQMQSAGFTPARADTLSFTAEGTAVANTSWLLDHVLASVWQAGGETGLTLFKVFVAAVIGFLLARISVPEMPTWWNSICAVLAAVAVSGHLMPSTELMTLLGVVLVLRWLHRYQEGTVQGLAWKIPALIAVWCNLDPHAWIGPVIVVLYAVGEALRQRIAARETGTIDSVGNGESLWLVGAVGVAALLINPFPLNSLFSPVAFYSVEVPSMQMQRPVSSGLAGISHDTRIDYFSALYPDAIVMFDHTHVAAITMIVIAVIVMLFARNRENLPFVTAMLGISLLGIIKVHELPAAALVAAVVAGTVAQRWYRNKFTLTYSTNQRELMFSRGGRAATVFAMAFLAFCIVAGRLPGRTPLGIGFEPDTATTIATVGAQLESVDADARILNTRIDQGDILIWHGRKSCIDSRLLPFGRSGNSDSIIARHRGVLNFKLHPVPPQPDKPNMNADEQAKFDKSVVQFELDVKTASQTLEDFGITHVMPRMAPPGAPDDITVRTLMGTGEWVLTSLGASAALLERIQRKWTQEERGTKSADFMASAFRDAKPVTALREFAQPPNFYETWVYRRRPAKDRDLRLADHYFRFSMGQTDSIDDALLTVALATLAVRESNLALVTNNQDAVAWRQLGMAYQRLGMLEESLAASQGGQAVADIRYSEAVTALRQAVRIDPDDRLSWESLAIEYQRQGSVDLLLECMNHIPESEDVGAADPQIQAMASARYEEERRLKDLIREQREREQQFDEQNPLDQDPTLRGNQVVERATEIATAGHQRRALELLQEHADVVRPNPVGQVLLGDLLLQTGDCEQGYQVLNRLASAAREHPQSFVGVDWFRSTAFSQLVTANYGEAASILSLQLQQFEVAEQSPETWGAALMSSPIVPDTGLAISSAVPAWPMIHTQGLQIAMKGLPAVQANICLKIALIHIEEGNTERAKLFLRTILTDFGDSPYRALAIFYLVMIDSDAGEFIEEYTRDDWEPFEFGVTDSAVDDPSAAASDGASDANGDTKTDTPEPAKP
jgi:tetratricopeptide (TPR) repeat protein